MLLVAARPLETTSRSTLGERHNLLMLLKKKKKIVEINLFLSRKKIHNFNGTQENFQSFGATRKESANIILCN